LLKTKFKTRVAILTVLVFVLSLAFSLPLFAADGMTVNFTASKLAPLDTTIQLDLSKGIDKVLEQNLSKISISEKATGDSITYADYKYTKDGQQDSKVRCLELFFNNLKGETTYVIELDADFAANNGSTLGEKKTFEFTTTEAVEQPVEPQPEEPVEPQPEQPVEPQPEEPVEPQPEQPVEPQPEEPVEPDVQLKDINGHWAETTISELVASGAVAGYPDSTFQPDKKITRAEFTTILVKAFKLDAKDGKDFADTANHWGKEAIATATAHGIVSGYDADNFGPDKNITREQMAVMIVKAAQLTENTEGKQFADNDKISSWAADAVATASQNKIITGYPDNSFQPQAEATRAEAATVIIKALAL
jgi:hypothetical protein